MNKKITFTKEEVLHAAARMLRTEHPELADMNVTTRDWSHDEFFEFNDDAEGKDSF